MTKPKNMGTNIHQLACDVIRNEKRMRWLSKYTHDTKLSTSKFLEKWLIDKWMNNIPYFGVNLTLDYNL